MTKKPKNGKLTRTNQSLRFYSQANEDWEEEIYFKCGLNKKDLKNLLLRGYSLNLGERILFGKA